jgi:bacillithiol biosynthesis cysteine-adding enzyme BshC
MNIEKIPFEDIPQLSKFDIAYQKSDLRLNKFYAHEPIFENFKTIIEQKKFDPKIRETLVKVLKNQYSKIQNNESVSLNLELLSLENSYTICTAHQPALLCGPLYFIYKICNCIKLSLQLKDKFPEKNFIPVYWMGGEDHDFEELNHLYLFGKKISWTDHQGGSVARYQVESLEPVLQDIYSILGNSINADILRDKTKNAFSEIENYGEGMIKFIHDLFGNYGLIIINPDFIELKRIMIPEFEDDLLNHSSEILIQETVEALKKQGFSNQAFVRPINLFYLSENSRNRIIIEEDIYKVQNSNLEFTKEQILQELKQNPDRFSPNVILRPIYQEKILPNLAFIGGAGELAYWMERKSQFEFYKIQFPMLIRRNSVLWLEKNQLSKIHKLDLQIKDIFQETDKIIRLFLSKNSQVDYSFSLEKEQFANIFDQIKKKTESLDASMGGFISAQQASLFNSIEKLESKLVRAEKLKQESTIHQIQKLQEKLYLPEHLQERKENFMSLYLQHGEKLLDDLIDMLDPFDKDFIIIKE